MLNCELVVSNAGAALPQSGESTACFGSYVWDGGAQYSINFATRKLFV